MTNLRPKIGRSASSNLREQAKVLLESYQQDGDVSAVLSALKYFSENGSFFDATNEKLSVLVLRMRYQAQRAGGVNHDDAVHAVAEWAGISVSTIERRFKDKKLPSEIANLKGTSELFQYLHQVANAKANKPRKN